VGALHRAFPFLVFLGATVCLSGGVANASGVKTRLIRDAVVNGESIYLSDLLPEFAPNAVRMPAEEILVGRSPQPGSIRVLSSGEIVQLLNGGSLLSQVDVPEQIVVHRSGRLITREEVAEAIRRTFSRNETFRNTQVAPEDIRLAARVSVLTDDADLRVSRIELDPTLHEMKFWIVSGAEPTLLPFIATAEAACGGCDLAEAAQRGAAQSDPHVASGMRTSMTRGAGRSNPDLARQANPAPVYVEAGKMARLHVISGTGMQMYLTATSFERGTLGQDVRVRIQKTGKVLYAHVVGRGQLEAEF